MFTSQDKEGQGVGGVWGGGGVLHRDAVIHKNVVCRKFEVSSPASLCRRQLPAVGFGWFSGSGWVSCLLSFSGIHNNIKFCGKLFFSRPMMIEDPPNRAVHD